MCNPQRDAETEVTQLSLLHVDLNVRNDIIRRWVVTEQEGKGSITATSVAKLPTLAYLVCGVGLCNADKRSWQEALTLTPSIKHDCVHKEAARSHRVAMGWRPWGLIGPLYVLSLSARWRSAVHFKPPVANRKNMCGFLLPYEGSLLLMQTQLTWRTGWINSAALPIESCFLFVDFSWRHLHAYSVCVCTTDKGTESEGGAGVHTEVTKHTHCWRTSSRCLMSEAYD